MLDLALLGATGRMGGAVLQSLPAASDVRLVGALASAASKELGRDIGDVAGIGELGIAVTSDPAAALARAAVAIDFSVAEAVASHVDACVRARCGLVLGVTALDDTVVASVRVAAREIAIVWSPNMSLGVNLCFALATRAAALLEGYDVEIIDLHHRHKRDAPSGTALQFGRLIERVRTRGTAPGQERGAGASKDVGITSLRMGEIAGEHTVMFVSATERVEITHRAAGRGAFAAGALAAARWVATKEAGLYGMHDVLGLEAPVSG